MRISRVSMNDLHANVFLDIYDYRSHKIRSRSGSLTDTYQRGAQDIFANQRFAPRGQSEFEQLFVGEIQLVEWIDYKDGE